MLRMSRFFLRPLIIALAAAVPLLAILAWTLSGGVDDTRDTAYRQVLAKSCSAARSLGDALDGAERLLVFVARHQDVRAANGGVARPDRRRAAAGARRSGRSALCGADRPGPLHR